MTVLAAHEGLVPFTSNVVPLATGEFDFPLGCAPLLARPVPAGFPSPADDYVEGRINLNAYLIQHEEATFFMRVEGDSMRDFGILDGDLLVVDRSLTAVHENVVIAVVDGEFTVKQLLLGPRGYVLHAANAAFADVAIRADQELEVWGVVRWAIHKVWPCPLAPLR